MSRKFEEQDENLFPNKYISNSECGLNSRNYSHSPTWGATLAEWTDCTSRYFQRRMFTAGYIWILFVDLCLYLKLFTPTSLHDVQCLIVHCISYAKSIKIWNEKKKEIIVTPKVNVKKKLFFEVLSNNISNVRMRIFV